jgi:2-polyprenyl-3-methyl-5-hydroxy-6-metoxy-1,4-benzoquinol methylase
MTYEEKLQAEARFWGAESERQARTIPPDWRYHRHLRHNAIMHTADIDQLLAHVTPGMVTLELGCASGWLTLAMAQRGAQATGIDISEAALKVAQAYYESVREQVSGSVTYWVQDLNVVTLLAEKYDIVAVKGTLHHLVRLDHVIAEVHKALKPGGLLWVADTHGEEALPTVLIASVLTFLLPTQVSYCQKIGGLIRFGLRAPSRIKASMEAEGLSPFEGAGREHDWLQLVQERFTVERQVRAPAFTGYVTAQLRLPERLALPLLRAIRAFDLLLVRLGMLPSTGLVIYARK